MVQLVRGRFWYFGRGMIPGPHSRSICGRRSICNPSDNRDCAEMSNWTSESFPPLQCCRKVAGKARVPVTGKAPPRPEVGCSRLPRLQDRLCGLPIVRKARVLCNDRNQLLELDAAMS